MTRFQTFRQRLKIFFQNKDNSQLVVSLAALAVSVYAILFSVHSFREQFELDMRPFVGVSNIQTAPINNAGVSQPRGVLIDATIKNVGKLPADQIMIHEVWKIVEAGKDQPIHQKISDERRFTMFPGSEFKRATRIEGAYFERYVTDPNYDLLLLYEIKYSNSQIAHQWHSSLTVRYNKISDLRVVETSGN